MILTRINLKLIKCDFLLDFIFLRNNKIWFSLWYLICSFKKNSRDMIHEKLKKKKRKMIRKRHYLQQQLAFLAWKTLKFGFLYFYRSYIKLNFLSKNISESIGILSSKLWPKYETNAEDNTNSALSSIFSQNFKWESTSNLFKPI